MDHIAYRILVFVALSMVVATNTLYLWADGLLWWIAVPVAAFQTYWVAYYVLWRPRTKRLTPEQR